MSQHRKREGLRERPLQQPLLASSHLLSSSPPHGNAINIPLHMNHHGRSHSWGRGLSPVPDARRGSVPKTRQLVAKAKGQQVQPPRQKDKFVPLPEDSSAEDSTDEGGASTSAPTPAEEVEPSSYTSVSIRPGSLFEDLPLQQQQQQQQGPQLPPSKRGRITLYAVADAFDRKKLEQVLRSTFTASAIQSYPDVFYIEYFGALDDTPGGDVFIFDYGVLATWGLDKEQEGVLVRTLALPAADSPFTTAQMEVDEFEFNYSSSERPHIQNDTVTLHRRAARDVQVKLAISYALAQSTKLSLHEKRVVDMVLATKELPEALAATGKVHISGRQIARLIGKVFIEKSAVNLLSSVLDTPEFFWRAPDSYQALYERITEYLETETRVEVLNARFTVLQDMLDMLRDHQNNYHSARLEWVVIYLIIVEVVVGLLELLGLFGLVGHEG